MTRTFPFKRIKSCQCIRSLHTASNDPYQTYLSHHPHPQAPPPSSESNSILQGKTIALKGNICTNDSLPTTCASRMLQDYFSPFDATIVTLLHNAGAIITGKTNMDEFAMGSTSTNTPLSVINPHRGRQGEELSAGGSSGGSAAAVAAGLTWGYIPGDTRAIGTDTGGSVRLPASYCGVVGFKPTYGLVSRYGVVSYAHSLDTVGFFTRSVPDAKLLFDVLNKHDKHDPTSLSPSLRTKFPSPKKHKWTFGIPRDYNLPSLHPSTRQAWSIAISKLQSSGNEVKNVSLPRTKEALSSYYVIATAEAASNLARYDGVRYGYRKKEEGGYREGVFRSREEGLGDEVRRRILLGNYTLSATAFESYFIQAQRVRRLIQHSFDTIFRQANLLHRLPSHSTPLSPSGKCDVILCPTTVGPAPPLKEISRMTPVETYLNDVFTVPASLAGLPAISVPVRVEGDVVGLQVVGQVGMDMEVLEAAEHLEELLNS